MSHAYGAVFDNPDLIACCVVGDGEAETGLLAVAWHSNKFLNPKTDGAVLPILHLNGYKIASPAVQARRLPIPQSLGLRRYGFHGLSYAHIARQLPGLLGGDASGRVVVAHLGNGASLCLLENLQSVDTSMGYTPAGDIPMGTRNGDLDPDPDPDPGVMLELVKRLGDDDLADLVYHRMGLHALSDGESSDMAQLLASATPAARFAVDYFCRQVRATIGAYAAKAAGIDALVFTGGIGEHAAPIRAAICEPLAFLGFHLDHEANLRNDTKLNAQASKPVLCIPADEESMIRSLVLGSGRE